MSSLAISAVVFACIFGGAVLGMSLRVRLGEHQLSPESKDVIKLAVGIIGTMTALVLGLLIASAKSSFDAQRNGLAQLSAGVIFLDRVLAHYGPESRDAREMLRTSVADMLQHTWPREDPEAKQPAAMSGTEGRYEGILDKVQELAPKTDAQRALQAEALKLIDDMAQTRWSLFAQKESSIPVPLFAVMVSWLTVILASFSLFARPDTTVAATLLICSLAVSSAVFLISELDQPFHGIIQISSDPLRNALDQLGR